MGVAVCPWGYKLHDVRLHIPKLMMKPAKSSCPARNRGGSEVLKTKVFVRWGVFRMLSVNGVRKTLQETATEATEWANGSPSIVVRHVTHSQSGKMTTVVVWYEEHAA